MYAGDMLIHKCASSPYLTLNLVGIFDSFFYIMIINVSLILWYVLIYKICVIL